MREKCISFLGAGLVVFVHSQPFIREAKFLQWPGHLWALRRRRGEHHRYAVLVQCQHRHGALTQVQQQSHTGEIPVCRLKCKLCLFIDSKSYLIKTKFI